MRGIKGSVTLLCPGCKQRNKAIGPSGKLRGYCHSCEADYAAYWGASNPNKKREAFLKNRYGITLAERSQMIAKQHNRCAICEEELTKPNIDHDHETGKIRGILCHSCNVGLGRLDTVEKLQAAINYLERANECAS